LKYISIDGDDVGRKITSFYLSNSKIELGLFSTQLEETTMNIADLLRARGFEVIFRAADGVVACTEEHCDFVQIFSEINSCSVNDVTFSAGVGSNLREAYVALLSSKSNGKNQLSQFNSI